MEQWIRRDKRVLTHNQIYINTGVRGMSVRWAGLAVERSLFRPWP